MRLIFGEGRPRNEQVLSNDEMASAVRDSSLNLLTYGAVTSTSPFPDSITRDTVSLPRLLHYSSQTRNHFNTLKGVLTSPREFKIVPHTQASWEGELDGDILYSHDTDGDSYRFANHLTSPHLNPFLAALLAMRRGDPYLEVNIRKNPKGVWEVLYRFDPPHPKVTIFDNDFTTTLYDYQKRRIGSKGPSGINPERALLVNLIFSPVPLKPRELIEYVATRGSKPYIKEPVRNKRVGNFETYEFHFEAERYARALKKQDYIDPREGVKHSDYSSERYCLETDGDRDFSIVKLGKQPMGNLTYHVYSAAEQAWVRAPKQAPFEAYRRTLQPQLSPA